jgi:hypothetical protein
MPRIVIVTMEHYLKKILETIILKLSANILLKYILLNRLIF